MSERLYLFLVGVYILSALYFGIDLMIYGLLVVLLFEAVTDIRLTTTLQRLRDVKIEPGFVLFQTQPRFDLSAIRAVRMLIAAVLSASFILVNEYQFDAIWFFPWFMGFAILGAGASGVCPMMLGLRWAGFR